MLQTDGQRAAGWPAHLPSPALFARSHAASPALFMQNMSRRFSLPKDKLERELQLAQVDGQSSEWGDKENTRSQEQPAQRLRSRSQSEYKRQRSNGSGGEDLFHSPAKSRQPPNRGGPANFPLTCQPPKRQLQHRPAASCGNPFCSPVKVFSSNPFATDTSQPPATCPATPPVSWFPVASPSWQRPSVSSRNPFASAVASIQIEPVAEEETGPRLSPLPFDSSPPYFHTSPLSDGVSGVQGGKRRSTRSQKSKKRELPGSKAGRGKSKKPKSKRAASKREAPSSPRRSPHRSPTGSPTRAFSKRKASRASKRANSSRKPLLFSSISEPAPTSSSLPTPQPFMHGADTIDKEKAELCRRFLVLCAEMENLLKGRYKTSVESKTVFEVKRNQDGGLAQVIETTEQCHNLELAAARARTDLRSELQARREEVKRWEQRVAQLGVKQTQCKRKKKYEEAESIGRELVEVLQVEAMHRQRIDALQEKTETGVIIQVHRSQRSARWSVTDTQETTRKECRTIPLILPCLYVLGGYDEDDTCLSSVHRYDADAKVWAFAAHMTRPRRNCAAVVLSKAIFAIGGQDASGKSLSSVDKFNPAKKSWQACAHMLSKRFDFAAAVLRGRIYAVGGSNDSESFCSVERYNLATDSWQYTAPMNQRRSCCAAAVLDGLLYVIGGSNDVSYLDSVEVFSPKASTWTLVTPMLAARYGCAAVACQGYLYAIGGQDSNICMASVERYDPKLDMWVPCSPMNEMRSYCTAVCLEGYVYVMGGQGASGSVLTSVEKYDPTTDSWEILPTSMSQARWCHAAVVGYHSVQSG
eukprot:g16122.t1